ncbi:unnamed protein product, partial [Mesorhabditis spiculigera]
MIVRIQGPCRAMMVSSSFRRLCLSRHQANSGPEAKNQTDPGSFDDFVDTLKASTAAKHQTFAEMFRHSKFAQLGDFDGRMVTGKIVHRVADDLYIDVGLKFNAVCKAPAQDGDDYTVGSRVLLRLHAYELSERFLGSKKDLTLLEADATLVRLLRFKKRVDKGDETTAKDSTTRRGPTFPVSQATTGEAPANPIDIPRT